MAGDTLPQLQVDKEGSRLHLLEEGTEDSQARQHPVSPRSLSGVDMQVGIPLQLDMLKGNLLRLPVAEVDRQDSLAGTLDSPHPGAAWGRATLLAVLAWHTRVAVR